MGLDSIELVMAFEEAFGVELADKEVMNTVTPRMIGDVIFSKLQQTDEQICQRQRAFYMLRRAFMKLFDLKRNDVKLDTLLRDYISELREKEIWQQLQSMLSVRMWPELERPVWMSRAIALGCLAILIISMLVSLLCILEWFFIGYFLGIILSVVFAILATKYTRSYKIHIPVKYICIRDLIPCVMSSDHMSWTRKQVSTLIKQITIEQLCIPDEKYTEDSHFVNDLGMC